MKFNQRLKQARRQRALRQKDMWQKLNLSPNGYASWEQGRTEPNIDSIKKLCQILDVSADYLLGISDDD